MSLLKNAIIAIQEINNFILIQMLSKNDTTLIIKPDKDNMIQKIDRPIPFINIDELNK